MRALRPLVGVVLFALISTGCNRSDGGATAAARPAGSPKETVQKFLQAVKDGDDKTAELMLTPIARQKTKEFEIAVAPPGSDTATFEVGEVEMIAEDGAHVACRWTDVGEDGQPRSDSIVWMCRLEEEGWRVAGMAAVLFPNEPPLFLNFEDPEDMIRKQELAAQEMERRTQGQAAGDASGTPATQVPASGAPPAQQQSPSNKVAAEPAAGQSPPTRQAQQPVPGPSRRK